MRSSQIVWFRYAVKAGFLGGLVFLVVEMILRPVFLNESAWSPYREIAALILDQYVLSPSQSSEPGVIATGLILHLALSILFALPFAFLSRTLNYVVRIIAGVIYGLILYLVNYYLFTYAFPWFAEARTWITILAHLSYGLVLALSFSKNYGPHIDTINKQNQ